MKQRVNSLEELDQETKQLLSKLVPGTIYFLNGEMGAGKTTFVSSIMRHYNFLDVSSPSYTLVNVYDSVPPVYHIDLYRCETQLSIDSIDLEYYFSSKEHLIFVEWGTRMEDVSWPFQTIDIVRLSEVAREITYRF